MTDQVTGEFYDGETVTMSEQDAKRLIRELWSLGHRACGCQPGDGCSDCVSESPVVTDALSEASLELQELTERLRERAERWEESEARDYRDTRGIDRFYAGQEPPFDVNDDFARTGSIGDY